MFKLVDCAMQIRIGGEKVKVRVDVPDMFLVLKSYLESVVTIWREEAVIMLFLDQTPDTKLRATYSHAYTPTNCVLGTFRWRCYMVRSSKQTI